MKSKVLFIMHMPPPVHGAAMMGKYIHDSKLINSEFECHYINLSIAKDMEDIQKASLHKLKVFINQLWSIWRTIKSVKPDMVYVTPNACGKPFYKDFVVVSTIKLVLKGNGDATIVAHYHNKGVSIQQDRWLDDKLYRWFFKGLKVILLSRYLYSDVQKYVKRENVMICPNGIPSSVSSTRTRNLETEKSRNPNRIPHILFLSNLLVEKGVLVLLDALEKLKDKGYPFVCDFVGCETKDIDAARFAKEVGKRGLNKIAIYHGKKYGADKEEFWKDADVFAFPTFYCNETFGLVNLEAMNHKIPIISTNIGGIPDVVIDGENGLLVEQKNSIVLADAIRKLLTNEPLRHKMGERGYQIFQEKFTAEHFERRMLQCLKTCLQ